MDYDTYSANDAIGKGTVINDMKKIRNLDCILILHFQNKIVIEIQPFACCVFSKIVYINLNPLLIRHGTSHQTTSVGGAGIGTQSDSDNFGLSNLDSSTALGDSGLIMGPLMNPPGSGIGGGGDDSAIITPNWNQNSKGLGQ